VAPRLYFGDDGSAGSDAAWEWINRHRWDGWQLNLVRVEPWSGLPAEAVPLHPVAQWRDPGGTADRPGFVAVEHSSATADPRVLLDGLPDAAALVVGARGAGLLKALHLGSTCEWLMQDPAAPLFVIRRPVATERVLVCADGSHHADAAVAALAGMPWLPDCAVTVVGVDDGRSDAVAAVRAAADALAGAGAVNGRVLRPEPTDLFWNVRTLLFDAIDEEAPDLVVAGTRGLTGLERLRVGSVASALGRHAACNLLFARAEG
jgi:nucleotide-binding universal stress UspA family protein